MSLDGPVSTPTSVDPSSERGEVRRPPRTIRTRILLAFLLSLVASATALGHSLLQLDAIGRNVTALDRGYLPLSRVATRLETVARQMNQEQHRLTREPPRTLAGYRANAAIYSAGISEAVNRGHKLVDRLSDSDELTDADRIALIEANQLLVRIDTERIAYDAAFGAWTTAAEADPQAAGSGQTLAELDARRTQLVLLIEHLSQTVEGRIALLTRLTARAQSTATRVSGALAVLAIVLSGGLTAVALVVLRPVGDLTVQVQRLAQGIDAGRIDVRGTDEVTFLAREFNAMTEAVSERDRRLKDRAQALDALSLRLRGIVDTLRAGLVVVRGGRASLANPAAAALWRIDAGDPVPASLGELPAGRHEGLRLEDRLFDVDVVPFGDGGHLIIGEDVTRRETDRARLARSERLALVGQMLAQITHEVRNPLNAMSLNADILHDELEDPEQRAMMDTISAEIRRLELLTGRYLEMTRGRQPGENDLTVDPRALVEEVLDADAAALDRAGVKVRVLGPRPGPRRLDADCLRRTLRNLLLNAAEAGARHVDITLHPDEEMLEVRVTDDGPGMAPEALRRAFDPFFTTKAQGTGLGLAISRQELEDIGGTLDATSRTGQGSTFRVRLPAGGVDASPNAGPPDPVGTDPLG